MTTTKYHSDWELDMQGNPTCMHFTEQLEDPVEDKNMMIRHSLLEVLDLLKVIEYSRGYDSIYYDVTLKRPRGK